MGGAQPTDLPSTDTYTSDDERSALRMRLRNLAISRSEVYTLRATIIYSATG